MTDEPRPHHNVFEQNVDDVIPEEWLTKEYWDAHPKAAARIWKAIEDHRKADYDQYLSLVDAKETDTSDSFIARTFDGPPIYNKDGELTGKAKDDFLQGLKPPPDSDPRENHRW